MAELLPLPPTPTRKDLLDHPEQFSIIDFGDGSVVYQHSETGLLLVLRVGEK